MLLGLRYEELSWDFAKPSTTDDIDCMPCIFIQVSGGQSGQSVLVKEIFKTFKLNALFWFKMILTCSMHLNELTEFSKARVKCTHKQKNIQQPNFKITTSH